MDKLITWLEKRQLTTKLLAGFSLCLLVVLILGLNTIISIHKMSDEAQNLYDNELVGLSHIKEANINLIYIGRSLRQMILADTPASREKAKARMEQAFVSLQTEMREARKRITREKNKKVVDSFDIEYAQYRLYVDRAVEMMQKEGYRTSEVAKYVGSDDFNKAVNTVDDRLNLMAQNKEGYAKATAEEMQRHADQATRVSIMLVIAGLIFGGVSGMVVGRSIYRPTNRLRESIEGLSAGRLDDAIPHTEYPNEIGAVARAVKELQGVYRNMENMRWVKSNLSTISTQLQMADDYPTLSQRLLSDLCPLLGVGHGVVYVKFEDTLRLLGSYGFREGKELNRQFAIGEGLAGQCALEKAHITITDPPAGYIKIGSGLGEASPACIVLLPIMHMNQLLGVLELASFKPLGDREKSLLDALVPVLGMTLQILERKIATQRLLEETQQQATRMEAQAAQLEEQAVEMEAQQAEIMQTEAWFRGIVESAPDGMVVVDAHGKVILFNPRAEEIFGYTNGELTGMDIDFLVPSGIRAKHPMMREKFMAEHRTRPMGIGLDLKGVRKDGTEFPIEVGLSRLPDVGGRGDCVCASVRDISERKQVEEAINKANMLSGQALDLAKAGYWHVPLDGLGWYTSSERAANVFGDIPREGWRYRIMEEWFANVEAGDKAASKVDPILWTAGRRS